MSSAIGGWLVPKKLEYVEENSYGITPASPSYSQIGYNALVNINAPTNLTPLLQPGSEDPQVLQERRIDEYNIDVQYRPYDTVFAKYGVNAQGGGSGTIDKSLSLAMSILLGGGPTETFIQALGCRIDNIRIGGKAGGPITVKAKIACRNIPVPSTTILAGTFAANPSTVPIQFKDGGAQPVSIGGTQYNINSINIQADRGLDRIPQPGTNIAQIILPTTRKITGTVGIVWLTTANYSQLVNDTPFTLVWTLKTGGSTLTLTGCRFKMLSSLSLTPISTVYEQYALEAVSGILT
jgi:hypothetical protein